MVNQGDDGGNPSEEMVFSSPGQCLNVSTHFDILRAMKRVEDKKKKDASLSQACKPSNIRISVYLSIHPSIYLSIYLSILGCVFGPDPSKNALVAAPRRRRLAGRWESTQ